jgi:hypothetical protein
MWLRAGIHAATHIRAPGAIKRPVLAGLARAALFRGSV